MQLAMFPNVADAYSCCCAEKEFGYGIPGQRSICGSWQSPASGRARRAGGNCGDDGSDEPPAPASAAKGSLSPAATGNHRADRSDEPVCTPVPNAHIVCRLLLE